MRYTKLLSSIILAGAVSGVMAQSSNTNKWEWNWLPDNGPFVEAAMGYSGTDNSRVNHKDGEAGWNLNGGFVIQGIGVEAGYTRYSDLQFSYGPYSTDVSLYSVHAALRVTPSIGPMFFIGKVGYAQLHQGDYDQNDQKVDGQESYGLYWALGVGVKLSQNFRIQATHQHVEGHNNIPGTSMTMIGAGFTFA
jgi:hypothetical protein